MGEGEHPGICLTPQRPLDLASKSWFTASISVAALTDSGFIRPAPIPAARRNLSAYDHSTALCLIVSFLEVPSLQAMDPLSLAASILTFMDAASKIKQTFDQVPNNRKRLRELSANIVKGIVDLEDLVKDSQDLDPVNAAKLRENLDDLKEELEQFHGRCRKYLERNRSSPLSSGAKATISEWFRRGDIDAKINCLERRVHSCYLRCHILITAGVQIAVAQTHFAMLRTEERVIIQRAEQQNNMERLENAFTQMIVDNDRRDLPTIVKGSSFLTQTDFDYLHRQVRRLVDAYVQRKLHEVIVFEEPSGSHLEEDPTPSSWWGQGIDMSFNLCLEDACHTLSTILSTSDHWSIQDCARSLLFLGARLGDLGLREDAGLVLMAAVTLYTMLSDGHPAAQFQRCLAWGLSSLSHFHESIPGHFTVSERAVSVSQALYERSGDINDLSILLTALQHHSSYLLANGLLDDALDCSQQTLILTREYSQAAKDVIWEDPSPIISWSASGEADVVFSSSREFSSCSYVAIDEVRALLRLAYSWAAVGQFAKAHITGMDTLSCLQAFIETDTWWVQMSHWNTASLREALASWVSIIRYPSQSGLVASIEEAEEENSSSAVVRNALVRPSRTTL